MRVYRDDIVDAGKHAQFVVLLAFLVTFLLVRGITHLIRSKRLPFLHDITHGNTHIHHLVWGILLLLITGYLGIALDPAGWQTPLALLFGVGAALTLDEFALWLRLEDVYWAKEGRRSVDAVIVTAILLALFVLGWRFWLDVGRLVGNAFGVA